MRQNGRVASQVGVLRLLPHPSHPRDGRRQTARRLAAALVAACVVLGVAAPAAHAKKPAKPKKQEAWIQPEHLGVFRFAADELPDSPEGFAAAMERGARRSLVVPRGGGNLIEVRAANYPV